MTNQNQKYRGILEVLKNSSCEEIEAFVTSRFHQNLAFFQADYPNLFERLQQPAKEYQLYIGKEGINILNFAQNSFLFPLIDGKSSMIEVHQNCAYNPPINEKWNRIYGTRAEMMNEKFPYSSILVNGILEFAIDNGGVTAYHLPSDFCQASISLA